MRAMPEPDRPSRLARYLALAYVALVVYASLFPLSGWRGGTPDPFAFLTAPLPRYLTAFDLAVNVLGYVPLGFLLAASLRPPLAPARAVVLATLAATALSFGSETAQNFLPARIPSNLDLGTNALGAFAGALGGLWVERRLAGRSVWRTVRERLFSEGHDIDVGLVLLALWLMSQLDPMTLLFGTGDLRELLASPTTMPYPPAAFVRTEAFVVAANLLAAALLVRLLVAPGRAVVAALALVIAALAVRSVAFGVLFTPQDAFAWMTPGARLGLASGTLVALLALSLPRPVAVTLAGLALMAATTVVNIAPANPYLAQALSEWRQGHFLNFNGLTRLVSTVWPFVALVYLLSSARWRDT
jgi:VanZ family protein